VSGVGDVFLVFLRLGLTSFGGPVAHIAFFRDEFVTRRRWLDEQAYAGLVGFCQFLPGPSSSQVAMGLGLMRARFAGLAAAWIGFTLPSALLMAAFAYVVADAGGAAGASWLHGLKIAAVAVVAQALWAMAQSLTPDMVRRMLALAAAAIAFVMPTALAQIAALAAGGVLGWLLLIPGPVPATPHVEIGRRSAAVALALFFALLFGLPLLARWSHALAVTDAFYRSGALVFGGGHVVLPLLRQAVVAPGWIADAPFLAGYGAAQAMPGPLFSFAAFLGTALNDAPNGWVGALLCLVAIYLPSLLLLVGAWPVWRAASGHPALRAALLGVNAAVVGLLLAAFINPVWTGAIFSPADFFLALAAFLLLQFVRAPSWAVVAGCALAGGLAGL
jgi:chromate transporter